MSGWIEYDSNNSGGHFWLSDSDWKALEDAGWHVNWIIITSKDYSRFGDSERYISAESGRTHADTREKALSYLTVDQPRWEEKEANDEMIVAVATTYDEALALREEHGGYFGEIAVSAVKEGSDPESLVAEFERLANQNANNEGCNCCGPPHSFTWHDDDGSTRHATARVTETRLVWL